MAQSGYKNFNTALPTKAPIAPVGLHAPDGRTFLGVRRRRDGTFELVYDRFGVRHSVWEVIHRNIDIDILNEACRRSVLAQDCLATLYACLATHGVRIQCKEDRLQDRI
jgi:hypothetical protein